MKMLLELIARFADNDELLTIAIIQRLRERAVQQTHDKHNEEKQFLQLYRNAVDEVRVELDLPEDEIPIELLPMAIVRLMDEHAPTTQCRSCEFRAKLNAEMAQRGMQVPSAWRDRRKVRRDA